jgi:hypothetical protein
MDRIKTHHVAKSINRLEAPSGGLCSPLTTTMPTRPQRQARPQWVGWMVAGRLVMALSSAVAARSRGSGALPGRRPPT